MSTLFFLPAGRRGALAAVLVALGFGFVAGRYSRPWSGSDVHAPGDDARLASAPAAALIERRPSSAPVSENEPRAEASSPRARWAELRARPPSAARERAMAECLRLLAATDPEAALALAREEGNFRVRQDLVVAALQGWAGRDPAASLAWAGENLFETNRRAAVEAIIDAGLVLREETMQAIRALCARSDSASADDYGRMLIAALAKDADFANALRFASEGGPHRDYWVGAALYSWSQYRPHEAAAALQAITEPATRNEALHGLILGWSANDPVSLLDYARALPAGPVRTEAFNQALQNWVAHDPVGASAWLDNHESDPELDSGAAKLATSPFLVANQVDTALSWANSVSDPEQRSIALVDVVQQWAKRDPAAARAYAEKLDGLQPAYREQLMKSPALADGAAMPPLRPEPQ